MWFEFAKMMIYSNPGTQQDTVKIGKFVINDSIRLKTYSLPEKYIIYLGSGTNRKNVVRMIEGFILWKKETHAKHKIVLISKFNRPETAITLTRIKSLLLAQGLHDAMVHIQYVDNTSKAALLSHAELFIYPSIYEGFGIPVIESLFRKKPVITSDISSLPEAAGPGAILVNPFSPDDIAKAIMWLEDKAIYEDLAHKGYTYVSSQYSSQKTANELMDFYKDITQK